MRGQRTDRLIRTAASFNLPVETTFLTSLAEDFLVSKTVIAMMFQ